MAEAQSEEETVCVVDEDEEHLDWTYGILDLFFSKRKLRSNEWTSFSIRQIEI